MSGFSVQKLVKNNKRKKGLRRKISGFSVHMWMETKQNEKKVFTTN